MVIYACEGLDGGNFNVTEVYLHAEFPENKHVPLKLRGNFVEIMCGVNPEHIKNLIYDNG